MKDLFISDINRLLDVVHLKKSNSLLSKVDEVTINSKLTVPALTRLEERFGKVPLTSHQPSTPHDLSDISSQLSRIESLICSGYSASSIYDSSSDFVAPVGRVESPSLGQQSNGSPIQRQRTASSSLHSETGELETARPYFRKNAVYKTAGFVGHTPLISRRLFTCECCENFPAQFCSIEELR